VFENTYFTFFFHISNKRNFTFFELLHTFSRTLDRITKHSFVFAVDRSRRIVNNFSCSALSVSICEKTVLCERWVHVIRSVIERVDCVLQFVVMFGSFRYRVAMTIVAGSFEIFNCFVPLYC